ncbi:MAG: hypothetical protein WCO25_05890 [Candidatus Uhrbacteria bacterium]
MLFVKDRARRLSRGNLARIDHETLGERHGVLYAIVAQDPLEDRGLGELVEFRAVGIFLDHAVSESERGNGFGSLLFDERLDRLVELGADVIFGRTMVTAPRQYAGNYLARGLRPIAADGTDEFSRQKHYFAAERADLRDRPKK